MSTNNVIKRSSEITSGNIISQKSFSCGSYNSGVSNNSSYAIPDFQNNILYFPTTNFSGKKYTIRDGGFENLGQFSGISNAYIRGDDTLNNIWVAAGTNKATVGVSALTLGSSNGGAPAIGGKTFRSIFAAGANLYAVYYDNATYILDTVRKFNGSVWSVHPSVPNVGGPAGVTPGFNTHYIPVAGRLFFTTASSVADYMYTGYFDISTETFIDTTAQLSFISVQNFDGNLLINCGQTGQHKIINPATLATVQTVTNMSSVFSYGSFYGLGTNTFQVPVTLDRDYLSNGVTATAGWIKDFTTGLWNNVNSVYADSDSGLLMKLNKGLFLPSSATGQVIILY